jgi:ABC-type phosphate transport system substrate-binding protein
MISRPLNEDEKGLFGFPVARDGVSLIVHESNPVASLTAEQIDRIFTGETATWRSLTGNYPLTRPLSLVTRELPASTRRGFSIRISPRSSKAAAWAWRPRIRSSGATTASST